MNCRHNRASQLHGVKSARKSLLAFAITAKNGLLLYGCPKMNGSKRLKAGLCVNSAPDATLRCVIFQKKRRLQKICNTDPHHQIFAQAPGRAYNALCCQEPHSLDKTANQRQCAFCGVSGGLTGFVLERLMGLPSVLSTVALAEVEAFGEGWFPPAGISMWARGRSQSIKHSGLRTDMINVVLYPHPKA